ncbi:MAG: (2Fe-2S)-binding protein [Phycisphaerae bacterium]|nr:(2Fe-2S)-binding protein [Phycisphaerae bacterium]|tara:strand:- start:562 stop:837 length:276 start_codon:yes stop_codon:yes gene_type:complete
MNKDDNVCVCHKVSLGKLQSYTKREQPKVASQLSECLGAGTSCGWCIPFLEKIHKHHAEGKEDDLGLGAEDYCEKRIAYLIEKKAKQQKDG